RTHHSRHGPPPGPLTSSNFRHSTGRYHSDEGSGANGEREGVVPGRMHRTTIPGALVCLALGLGGGGGAFGPGVLEQPHGRYYESVRLVTEEELLRNLVHMRYNEVPGSLDVSAIAAQYELTGQAEARPFFAAPNPSSHDIFHTFTSILPDILVG